MAPRVASATRAVGRARLARNVGRARRAAAAARDGQQQQQQQQQPWWQQYAAKGARDAKPKRVQFGVGGRARAKAARPEGGKPLSEYMSLSFDDYNLLDPELISRVDLSEPLASDAEEAAMFRFTLPLDTLVQMPCRPEMDVLAERLCDEKGLRLSCLRATITGDVAPLAELPAPAVEDEERGGGPVDAITPGETVTVESAGAKAAGADEKTDSTPGGRGAESKLEVWQPPDSGESDGEQAHGSEAAPGRMSDPVLRRRIADFDEAFELDWSVHIEWGESHLRSRLRSSCAVLVPPPFSAPPRPLIGGALTAAGRTVVGILLPRVLQEVARDYQRWALGGERVARSGALTESEMLQQNSQLSKPGR